MITFFNYFYYRTLWWNINVIKNNSYPYFATIAWLTALQSLDFQFLIDITGVLFFNKTWINKINTTELGVVEM